MRRPSAPVSSLLPATLAVVVLVLALVVTVLPAPANAGDRITGETFATRSEVLGAHGMVATSQPLATQAGLEILKKGGNAVDAAIAANAMLALVEPTGCGLGGDLFAIVWNAEDGSLHGLNGSGRSPMALTREELLARLEAEGLERIPPYGPLPVSVPGAVDGWFTLHQRFGRLPMAEVLAPAIRTAREGFPVTELIAHYWDLGGRRLAEYPGFADVFLPGGEAPGEGEIFRNPALASTLEALAEEGRDAFYEGDIARTIDRYMEEHGGYLSYEDLAAHRSEWVEPVSTTFRGHRVWQLPPNGQGIATLQILNLIEPYDLASMGFGSADYLHRFIEAKKLTFEDRARWYADMDFADVPVEGLISKPYADRRRELIDPQRAGRAFPPGNPALGAADTIYLAVGDDDGNMVSLIQSNFRGMGSGMVPPGLGFVLQDRGELFVLDESHPNSYAPGKRPFHTIIPGFVTRGEGEDHQALLAFGVMGGDTQPQAQAQVLVNLFDFGMNLQEAGDAPRFLHTGSTDPWGANEPMTDGGTVIVESGIPYATVRELMARGHRVSYARGPYGGYQAVWRDPETGVYRGASESRKDGHAAGY